MCPLVIMFNVLLIVSLRQLRLDKGNLHNPAKDRLLKVLCTYASSGSCRPLVVGVRKTSYFFLSGLTIFVCDDIDCTQTTPNSQPRDITEKHFNCFA